MSSEDILSLRTLIQRCVKMHQYRSAVFWADKLMNLSKDTIKDTLLFADVLINAGQYYRAIDLLNRNEKLRESLYGRFLIAQCYFKCKEFVEALNMLENMAFGKSTTASGISISRPEVQSDLRMETPDSVYLPDGVNNVMLSCSIALLRGHVHEALNNPSLAVNCYKEAFKLDPFCFEALEHLLKLEALSDDDEKWISKLELQGFSPALANATKCIYSGKVPKEEFVSVCPEMEPLQNSVDVLIAQAEKYMSINHYRRCYEITSQILENDPLNPECLPIHISVLKILDKPNDLFRLANNLIKLYPRGAISWFATGTYFLSIRRNDMAKRHLRKATQEDRRFGPAWLALGHAYAADNEHDQAIASYCTAAQIVRHSHIPMLYIGVEYSSSGNQVLAERFMLHALQCSPKDPAVLHELGTLALNLNKFNKALKYLKQAYQSITELSGQVIAAYWEPLLNNLGFAYRELGHFEEALKMHEVALKLVAESPFTLETMGLIYAQMGQFGRAISALQRAVSLHASRTDAETALDMLDLCHERYASQLIRPLARPSASAPASSTASDGDNEQYEVGYGINDIGMKEHFSVVGSLAPFKPPAGIPSIREDLDITHIPEPQQAGPADSDQDVSMDTD